MTNHETPLPTAIRTALAVSTRNNGPPAPKWVLLSLIALLQEPSRSDQPNISAAFVYNLSNKGAYINTLPQGHLHQLPSEWTSIGDQETAREVEDIIQARMGKRPRYDTAVSWSNFFTDSARIILRRMAPPAYHYRLMHSNLAEGVLLYGENTIDADNLEDKAFMAVAVFERRDHRVGVLWDVAELPGYEAPRESAGKVLLLRSELMASLALLTDQMIDLEEDGTWSNKGGGTMNDVAKVTIVTVTDEAVRILQAACRPYATLGYTTFNLQLIHRDEASKTYSGKAIADVLRWIIHPPDPPLPLEPSTTATSVKVRNVGFTKAPVTKSGSARVPSGGSETSLGSKKTDDTMSSSLSVKDGMMSAEEE